MKASQTEIVIMLTCCALQSACYSPTGIVISFILAQFQGEVQTNLTVKRFLMCSAIGLRHPASASCLGRHLRLAGRCPNNSSLLPPLAAVVVVALCTSIAEELFIISHLSRPAGRSKRIFTGGVVTENGSCSAAFCESAALRGMVCAGWQREEPSQAHCVRQLPRRGSFISANRQMTKSSPFRGSWHGVSRD